MATKKEVSRPALQVSTKDWLFVYRAHSKLLEFTKTVNGIHVISEVSPLESTPSIASAKDSFNTLVRMRFYVRTRDAENQDEEMTFVFDADRAAAFKFTAKRLLDLIDTVNSAIEVRANKVKARDKLFQRIADAISKDDLKLLLDDDLGQQPLPSDVVYLIRTRPDVVCLNRTRPETDTVETKHRNTGTRKKVSRKTK